MDKDLPDFLSDAPQGAPEAAQEPAAPAEGASPGAIQAEPEASPAPGAEPAPEAAPADQQQHGFVPIAALLDERDRRQASEGEAERLRQWRQQEEERARRQQTQVPDRVEDPEGYEAHREAVINEQFRVMHRTASKRFATMEHGQDAISAAEKWYDEKGRHDPFFNQKVWTSDDPYGVVIAEWKRSQFLEKADPNEYDAFLVWKAQQAAQAPAAAPPAAGAPSAPPAAPTPPRASLAGGPSAGRVAAPIPRDGADTYAAMFEK